MAYTPHPNTANAFTPRTPGDAEFTGNGDIDGQPYSIAIERVFTRRANNGWHYVSRKVTLTDADTGRNWVYTGLVFDRRIDGATGDLREIGEKSPSWTGEISAEVGLTDKIVKEISIWEKLDKNQNIFYSCRIRNPGERPAPYIAGAAQPIEQAFEPHEETSTFNENPYG